MYESVGKGFIDIECEVSEAIEANFIFCKLISKYLRFFLDTPLYSIFKF